MDTWILVVVILLVAVILGIVIGTVVVYMGRRREDTEYDAQETVPVFATKWNFELWDIGTGDRYQATFDGGLTLGRSVGTVQPGCLSVGDNPMLSREQCLVFEQYGTIYVSNLSQVNITYLNGAVLAQPMPLAVGDRLAMGGHTYLVTELSQMTAVLNAGETYSLM